MPMAGVLEHHTVPFEGSQLHGLEADFALWIWLQRHGEDAAMRRLPDAVTWPDATLFGFGCGGRASGRDAWAH